MTDFDWIEYEREVRDWAKLQNGADENEVNNAAFFRDGIVNKEEWDKDDNPKILVILKEVYDQQERSDGPVFINFFEEDDIYRNNLAKSINFNSRN